MSSSTVSVTANPSGAPLRRHILTGENKSGLDLAGSEGFNISPATDGETSREKDISHSIKAGTETKNPILTISTTKLRKRTVVKKGSGSSFSRTPWKTAVSVIVKNLSLLVILLLLIQMVRRLAFKQGGGFDSGLNPNSNYERRIAEVEELVAITTDMMQVHVDRKIVSEISGLKSEIGKRIDDQRVEFANRFSEFDGRIGSMEKSLSSTDWLSKDEFDRFVEDFRVKKGVDAAGELKLDEIRTFAREIVEKEIGKHAADGLGRVDYAVASGGGMVLKHSEAFNGARRGSGWFSGNVRNDAVKMLQPSFGQPGECFPLKGDNGFVEIKLRSAIVPEAITLEHVSKSVAFDRTTAPKDCKVWGWLRNEEDAQREHLLTEFTYDLEKSSSQTFDVLLGTEGVNPRTVVDTMRLQFMSNHGSPTHTCIYRVRVHGHRPSVS